VTIALNIVTGLVLTPVIIKSVGDTDYGLYSTASTLIAFFLIDFGIGSSVSKFVAQHVQSGDDKKADELIGALIKLYLILSVIITAVLFTLYFFIDTLYVKFSPEDISTFKSLYIIASCSCMFSFAATPLNGILMGNEKFIAVKVCGLVQKSLTVLLTVMILLFHGDVISLVLVNGISNVFIGFLKLIIVKRLTRFQPVFYGNQKALYKTILSFSCWVLISQIAQRLIFNIEPTILASTTGAVAVTMFSLSSSIEGYCYTIAEGLNGLFLSSITRIKNAENSQEKLMTLAIRVARIQCVIIYLIFAGFVVVGQSFIKAWTGPEYLIVYPCTILLIAPSVFELPQQICRTSVLVYDKVKYQAYIYILMSAVNIVLSVVFSLLWGALGACVAICVAYLVRTFGMNVVYQKVIGIRMGNLYLKSYLRLLPAPLAAIAFGLLVGVFITCGGWTEVILKTALVMIVYCAFLVFLLNEEEKRTLKKMLGKLIPVKKHNY
jgi:O-antigen/teichoic acid export membrane protein